MFLGEGDYYDLHDILTRNAVLNFILGGRGIGKTFCATKTAIKQFITKKWQFIYLRRYDTEVATVKPTFFKDMTEEFPDYAFQCEGITLQICFNPEEKKKTWHVMGYIVSLNTSGALKSVPFPDVHTIIFDEIFPNKGASRYLSGEVNIFQEFYSTVDRWKDKTRVIALANAVSLANPYFSAYGMNAEEQKKPILTYAKGFIALEIADYKGFSSKIKTTRFGKFIQQVDPDYAKYSMNNEFRDNTKNLVEPLDKTRDRYNFTVETEQGIFNIWSHFESGSAGGWYTLSYQAPKFKREKTTVKENVTPEKTLLTKNDEILKRLSTAYRAGMLKFDSAEIKAIYIDLFGSTM